jgi:hypothetical protein
MDETLGKTVAELQSFLGLYLDMDGNSGMVQGYPNKGQLCAFKFENGKVVYCEALFISDSSDIFASLVDYNTELLGEPLSRDVNQVKWEIKAGILGFVNNPRLNGANGGTIGVEYDSSN